MRGARALTIGSNRPGSSPDPRPLMPIPSVDVDVPSPSNSSPLLTCSPPSPTPHTHSAHPPRTYAPPTRSAPHSPCTCGPASTTLHPCPPSHAFPRLLGYLPWTSRLYRLHVMPHPPPRPARLALTPCRPTIRPPHRLCPRTLSLHPLPLQRLPLPSSSARPASVVRKPPRTKPAPLRTHIPWSPALPMPSVTVSSDNSRPRNVSVPSM